LRKIAQLLEGLGGVLLCSLAVMTPWLFGTTEDWSIRVMNIGCLVLGAIFLSVWLFERFSENDGVEWNSSGLSKVSGTAFLIINLLLLAFCVVAYLNARATFSMNDQTFNYFEDFKPNLPTTYDKDLTEQSLITYLGLFAMFWSGRYWLARGWERVLRRGRENPSVYNNRRFRALLWVLVINGILLAIQAMLQRLGRSEKLLWWRDSWWKDPDACFGPFSYRGNAADYFNLIWPLAFGFFILVLKYRRTGDHPTKMRNSDGPQLLLIPGLLILAIAPIFSFSRGGTVVAAVGFLVFIGMLFLQRSISKKAKLGFLSLLAILAIAGWGLAAPYTRARLQFLKNSDFMTGRTEIYANARQITHDYPLFGTGPGTFRSVYHLYRTDVSQEWHAFVHDDWLETRATFGWVGFSLAVLQLATLLLWILSPGRAPVPEIFTACLLISLGGTLLHAKFDFPFQTYSIFFTFVLISAIAVSSSPIRRV
jgi:hypothetical protein